jgi:hypothetical protein
MRKTGMVVEATQDRHGWVTLQPASQYWSKRFRRAVLNANDTYNAGLPSDASVFFQGDIPITHLLENDMPKRYHRDFDHGWTVRFLVDPWVYAIWLGWDICESF